MKPASKTPSQSPGVRSPSPLRLFGCAALAFLLGAAVAAVVMLLFLKVSQSDRPALAPPPPQAAQEAFHVQISQGFVTQLAQRNIHSAGLPGQVSNVQVVLTNNAPMTVTGDDQLSVLGISFTRHFTVLLQPFVQSCRPHVRVLHADMDGIPVTGFVASFEAQINQQLQFNTADLPQGFTYCATSVQTQTNALSVSFSATPIS